MFTGIVEEIGQVESWSTGLEVCQLTILCDKVLQGTKLGDSIAVNGVCLTVAKQTRKSFTADILVESLNRTALVDLKARSRVNLERALPLEGRLGGHFVTGHIDCVARISKKWREKNSLWYRLEMPLEALDFLVAKGSIALDGTSLTIARVEDRELVVSLIPHTLQETVLGEKGTQDRVNVEADILSKYVLRHLSQQNVIPKPQGITLQRLKELGFA